MKPWESFEHARYYLLGVYLSDGSLDGGERFRLTVKDQEFRDTAVSALSVLGIKHSCRECHRKARRIFETYHREAGIMFQVRVLSSPRGDQLSQWMKNFTRGKETLPRIPPEYLPELVAGILDGDGGARVTREGRPRITVSGKCGYLPPLIKNLREFGVRVTGPYSTSSGGLRYLTDPQDFLDKGLFFRLSRKQEKLVLAVRNTRR